MATVESIPSPLVAQRPAPSRADWPSRLATAWLAVVLPLVVVALLALRFGGRRTIADLFLIEQDFPLALVAAAVLVALRVAPPSPFALRGLRMHGAVKAGLLAAAAAAVGGAGWFLVFHAYPLSMDEFMAGFDAAIFAHGHAAATIPPEWRAYTVPLQPQFMIFARDGAHWASEYLPVNALFRALLSLAGLGWAEGPLFTALSIGLVFALARRLWPARPDAALVAALLLATSSQVLVTGMTGYAMSAHLALNLPWLWLFLSPGWRAQVGAALVAFLACGLHQLVFHPLFAAPFVLGLWFQRRWGRAAFYTAAYGLIGIFWLSYWTFVFPDGGSGILGAADPGVGFFARRLQMLLANFNLYGVGLMAKNLLRLIAWQNPLLPALALVGGVAAVRTQPVLRSLAAGAGLMLVVAWVLLPFQGHGWGYRYLHGFLGGFALIAAFAWIELTERLDETGRGRLAAAFCLSAAVSLAVLLPLHAFQAEGLTRSDAVAARALARTDADVVLVDPSRLFYAADLVRNDALLRNRPKVMDLGVMTDAQVRSVCARYRVALFERREGLALGLDEDPGSPSPRMVALRRLLSSLNCGERIVPTAL